MRSDKTKRVKRAAIARLNDEIGERIRAARDKADWTQGELARELGYARPATISYMESGTQMINAADLPVIASLLGVTVRSLFPKGSVR